MTPHARRSYLLSINFVIQMQSEMLHSYAHLIVIIVISAHCTRPAPLPSPSTLHIGIQRDLFDFETCTRLKWKLARKRRKKQNEKMTKNIGRMSKSQPIIICLFILTRNWNFVIDHPSSSSPSNGASELVSGVCVYGVCRRSTASII